MGSLTLSPLWNIAAFGVAAAAVWWAGGGLARHAKAIAERTGIGKVFAGAVLLGVATSLPEIATTVSAATAGAAALAGNNLLGGAAMQVAVLAVADMTALRRRALTFFSPDPTVLLHGVYLILMLAVALMAMAAPDFVIGGRLSLWSVALAGIYLLTVYGLYAYEREPRWQPRGDIEQPPSAAVDAQEAEARQQSGNTVFMLVMRFCGFAVVVSIAGYVVASTGEALARQTGLGETFIGATLVAGATSLPELSTTHSAVRSGSYSMAMSNILGTNALEIALFLPADLAYAGGSIFAPLDQGSVLLGAIGIVVTGTYLWGVLERADRTVGSLGIDSALVLATYAIGMVLVWLSVQ